MDCENIFNTKKDTCHISFPYLPFSLTVIILYRRVESVGSFLKNFFFNFLPNNNMKIKNYPLSLNVARKALALLK